MKKILILFALCMCVFTSCESKMDRVAKKLQNCPTMKLPGFGEINSCYVEGTDVVFETDASARFLSYDVIKREENKHMIGDNAVSAVFQYGIGDDVLNPGSDIGVVFRFQWRDGQRIDVRFSPSEIQARSQSIANRFSGCNPY